MTKLALLARLNPGMLWAALLSAVAGTLLLVLDPVERWLDRRREAKEGSDE